MLIPWTLRSSRPNIIPSRTASDSLSTSLQDPSAFAQSRMDRRPTPTGDQCPGELQCSVGDDDILERRPSGGVVYRAGQRTHPKVPGTVEEDEHADVRREVGRSEELDDHLWDEPEEARSDLSERIVSEDADSSEL